MTSSTPGEDLFFWGMFKKKKDKRLKKEMIFACYKCGSKRINKVTLQEPVFTKLEIPFKCENCKYQGSPRKFDSEKEYKKFIKKIK